MRTGWLVAAVVTVVGKAADAIFSLRLGDFS
jgi:hypothetical protein